MKKLIGLIVMAIIFVTTHSSYANNDAQLSIKINGLTQHYYLCLYGTGCFNINAAHQIKSIPILPMDLGNITKMVITDGKNKRMYMQPTNQSCNVTVSSDQNLTISGTISVKNNKPILANLHCSVI